MMALADRPRAYCGGAEAGTHIHPGACFCGAVQIEVIGAPVEMGYCHCSSCRTYPGAPLAAYASWKDEAVRVTGGAHLIGRVNKTGMNERQFCTRCGGHVMTLHPGLGFTDVLSAVIRRRPVPVLRVSDRLPERKDVPAQAGGPGEVVPAWSISAERRSVRA